jgi:hypothetical protein
VKYMDLDCRRCFREAATAAQGLVAPAGMQRCPGCGNKRCPQASDHRLGCTGSNEPGQAGSDYPAAQQQDVAETERRFASLFAAEDPNSQEGDQ